MPKPSSHMLTLARKGAEARIKELEAEIAQLRNLFGSVPYGSAVSPAMPVEAKAAQPPTGRKRKPGRRGWTAAQRKAQAAKMKAYWATKRKR